MSDEEAVPSGQVLPATQEIRDRIERRWEGLNERVQAKVQSISGRDRTPEARLIQQAASAGTVTKRVAWLRKAADYVNAGAAHLAACRKGCAACCHIAVMISRAEAQVIARETGAKLNPKAGVFSMADSEAFGEAFKQATSEAVGKPCTFLKEGSCSIYAHRPLECRLLLNLDDDDLLCQLVEGSATNVPYLDARQHHVASVAILGQHQDYDDIRNWFPQGRAKDMSGTQHKAV